jgi:hypothetical protein
VCAWCSVIYEYKPDGPYCNRWALKASAARSTGKNRRSAVTSEVSNLVLSEYANVKKRIDERTRRMWRLSGWHLRVQWSVQRPADMTELFRGLSQILTAVS